VLNPVLDAVPGRKPVQDITQAETAACLRTWPANRAADKMTWQDDLSMSVYRLFKTFLFDRAWAGSATEQLPSTGAI